MTMAAAKDDLRSAQAKRLLGLLDTFEAKYGTTELAEGVRDERTTLRARLLELGAGWTSLFDGKTLDGWQVMRESSFAGGAGFTSRMP